jgi:L-ascorbate metabolism protein UlaG (beta-lactamase superfamily)
MSTRVRRRWDADLTPALRPLPAPRVTDGIAATFINHATVLLQTDGVNVLVDPIWSERASPLRHVGPRRKRAPGLAYDALPPIDLVLISHDHYDHLDGATIGRLARDHDPLFVAGLGNERLLRRLGARRVATLDWWQTHHAPALPAVTFTPAKHFSGRSLLDRDRTLWGGFVLHAASGPVFFAGDTGYGRHFAEVAARLGSPRLALLPIGAYKPRWFMAPVHMDPDDAVRAHLDLGAHDSMAVHFGTFQLADDGRDDPAADLAAALARHGVSPERFWLPEFGEGRTLHGTAARPLKRPAEGS